MIQTLFHRLGLILGILLLQILVLNHICLWGYAIPLLGCVTLFYTPLDAGRIQTMLIAFGMGLVLDAFSNSPGVAAAAMTLTAFVQYPLLHAMAPDDIIESTIPDIHMLGGYKYFFYMSILMAVHHVTYFLLESFSFFNLPDLLLRFASSYLFSMLLALSIELWRTSEKND